MRRTTTIRSRFITYIRSLRAKSVAATLTWVFLLILSCTDDAALVGFRKDPRLGTRYVEIPLDYGVVLHEPISTQNVANDDLARLMVGRADDPDLGTLEATAFFNFSPPIQTVFPSDAAVFKSLTLQLKFDYYSYGSTDSTDMQLNIHELTEQMTPDHVYYSGTPTNYSPTVIGDTTFAIGPLEMSTGWALASDNDLSNDVFLSIPIPLTNTTIGSELLSDLIRNRLIFDDFNEFSLKYPGFAATMPVSDKIIGFTPVYGLPTPGLTDSKLVLTYEESSTLITVEFPIYYATINNVIIPTVSYTYLSPNFTGSKLDGIQPFQDYTTSDNQAYVQCGTGVMAKFDLTHVYDYFDTVDYAVINEAELILDNVYTGRTPKSVELLLLDSLNQFRGIYIDAGLGNGTLIKDPYIDTLYYHAAVVPLGSGLQDIHVAIFNTLNGTAANVDQSTGQVGSTIITEFIQQIVYFRNFKYRAKSFVVHPVDNEFFKSVSALKLSASSAKLRIYYSKPLTGLP